MDVYGLTDVGKNRIRNEDHFLIATLSKSLDVSQSSLDIGDETRLFGNSQGRLLLVADGMGGHAAGDRASATAITAFADYVLNMLRWYFRADPTRDEELAADLREAVLRCQRGINEAICENPSEHGMGSTLTLCYVIWPRMFVAHVGDSRCYLLRGGELKQLTRDHTIAEKLVEESKMTPEEAVTSRWQHVLWNSVGGSDTDPQPDIFRVDLEFEDRLMLCTDGLSNCVSDSKIFSILNRPQPASEICRVLIDSANEAGGADNITTIAALFPKPKPSGDEYLVEVAEQIREAEATETVPIETRQTALST